MVIYAHRTLCPGLYVHERAPSMGGCQTPGDDNQNLRWFIETLTHWCVAGNARGHSTPSSTKVVHTMTAPCIAHKRTNTDRSLKGTSLIIPAHGSEVEHESPRTDFQTADQPSPFQDGHVDCLLQVRNLVVVGSGKIGDQRARFIQEATSTRARSVLSRTMYAT